MADTLRDRVAPRVRAGLLLGLVLLGVTAACSTGLSHPAASPEVRRADEDNCVRTGGLWRNGFCDIAGSGGGGGGGY
jgi:hypothetical protein